MRRARPCCQSPPDFPSASSCAGGKRRQSRVHTSRGKGIAGASQVQPVLSPDGKGYQQQQQQQHQQQGGGKKGDGKGRGVCFYHQKGKCTKGDSCRYEHPKGGGAVQRSQTQLPVTQASQYGAVFFDTDGRVCAGGSPAPPPGLAQGQPYQQLMISIKEPIRPVIHLALGAGFNAFGLTLQSTLGGGRTKIVFEGRPSYRSRIADHYVDVTHVESLSVDGEGAV